jgi:hypothetical protein
VENSFAESLLFKFVTTLDYFCSFRPTPRGLNLGSYVFTLAQALFLRASSPVPSLLCLATTMAGVYLGVPADAVRDYRQSQIWIIEKNNMQMK